MPADKHITTGMWASIAIEWWFLGLVAYHLILEKSDSNPRSAA
jgi:hypothetical protein